MKKELSIAKKAKTHYRFSEEQYLAADRMYQRIKGVVPYLKRPNLDAWANTLRLMIEQDDIPFVVIGEVFRWANQHEFWSTNILSPQKLRKQFPRLHVQMLQERSRPRRTKDISLEESLTDTSWADGISVFQPINGDNYER